MLDLNSALSFFAAMAMTVAEVLGKLVIAVLDVTIPVMQYQGFTNSPVVIAGWSIVRDVVNMFFVVVLIVIAMGTIFGSSRFQWKQAVPRLMIFAILINFSKTLCGLMIDFAQVVMLTFANALKDIAGGNFIQLLGLGDIFSLSEKAETIAASAAGTGTGSGPFDYFAASLAAVFMMIWVLAVVVMLLFILVYRVVMLWILIVMAPLAWFMGGQSVFKSDAYSQWWQNFVCYTAIGPVITFFLWLTLAVAGSGFIAANDPGFSSAVAGDINSNASDFVTRIFEFQRLASFVIGMAMLMAGFDAAAKLCGAAKGPGFQALLSAGKGVPGKLGGYVSRGSRKGLSYVGSGAGAVAGGIAGGAVGAGAASLAVLGGAGLGAFAPTSSGQAQRAQGMRNLGKKLPSSMNSVSKQLSSAADSRQKELAEKLKKGYEEGFKDMSSESKVDYLKNMADGGMPVDPAGKKAVLGLLAEAIKDPAMREKLEAAGVLGTLYAANGPTLKEYLRNTPDYKMLDEFEAGRPDITGNVRGINTMEDVDKLDPAALARLRDEADRGTAFGEEFKNRMKGIKSNTKKNYRKGETMLDGKPSPVNQVVTLDAWDHFQAGMGGVKKQKAWTKGMGGVYEGMGKVTLDLVPADEVARVATPELVGRRSDVAKRFLSSTEGTTRTRMSANPDLYRSAAAQNLGVTYAPSGAVDSVNPAMLKAAIKSDPSLLTNIQTEDIEINRNLAVGIADQLDAGSLGTIVKQYAKASSAERAEMDASVIENVFQSMEQARDEAVSVGNAAEVSRLDDLTLKFHKGLVKIDGTKANMDSKLTAEITAASSVIAAETAKGAAANAALIARLSEDTRRLTNRQVRHAALP